MDSGWKTPLVHTVSKEIILSEERKNKNTTPGEETAKSLNEAADAGVENIKSDSSEPDVDQLQQELVESRDQFLRLAAEFDNFKKRMAREREALIKYAGENILRELLTAADNLDRALEQGSADSGDAQKKLDALLEGVRLTQKGLLATLERFEVVPIESVGRLFDPNEHEAMTMEASDTVPANHVLQEYARGYRFRDRLLRPAKVVVSQGNK
jgi:molecular chaperone GrpE